MTNPHSAPDPAPFTYDELEYLWLLTVLDLGRIEQMSERMKDATFKIRHSARRKMLYQQKERQTHDKP